MSLSNAFVTLLTTPSYLPGALVLLHSLLDLHPAPRDFKTVCLVTPETVDASTIGELRKAGFDLVIGVEPIGSGSQGEDGLKLMGRPDLNFALTKLHLFRLSTLFSTIIYLDADVLPLRPLSHLFTTTTPHVLSACPDTGWPDCFNSGVMVIRPRESDWSGLRNLLQNGEGEEGIYLTGNGSFDGADQGLLNEWFSEEGGGGAWNRLPFTYNVTPSAAYTYAPAYKRYGHKINAVHFIGPHKPWSNLASRPAKAGIPQGKEQTYDYPALIDRWYAVYDRNIRPTAAHSPDIALRFTVPELPAVWNQPATSVPHQPEDRLDLDQLKSANQAGVTAYTAGQYTSLPLEGRVDLVMPKPKPRHTVRFAEPDPEPSALTDVSTCDVGRSAGLTPAGGGPEMATPMNTVYTNAWEATPAQQSSYYSSGPASHAEPEYPTLPENVQHDDWYKQYVGHKPDRSNLHPVFPWETQHHHHRASRVFPRDEGEAPQYREPEPSQNRHAAVSITVQSATPPPRTSSPPAQSRSMADAMATYTNAWDNMPSIQRYVDRISGQPVTRATKDLEAMGLQSVPSTPRLEHGTRRREISADRRSDLSGDGDDEDEGDADDDEPSSPSIGRSSSGSLERPLLPPSSHGNPRYFDRQAQTDPPVVSDAKVQVYPGGGPSPAMRTIELPSNAQRPRPKIPSLPSDTKTIRGYSSSDTARPRYSSSDTALPPPQIITPPSDAFSPPADGATRGVPFPSGGPHHHQHPSFQPPASGPYSIEAKTDSGVPRRGNTSGGGRIWDPSTSLDTRRKETQEVLGRFMKVGFGSTPPEGRAPASPTPGTGTGTGRRPQ
ncbi:nucleotide-diphospho-sugar transferase [Naematelia encephala]|uniref:Nucleotide-diphospho-sugar transferase n=1 Tax=Naematelia encephala TaxID=71784 RepID=A0A1Y2B8F6_9TREE|nr:nucleotide-diphospho-sugar transferase [Naematelia encephala]